MAAVTKAIDRVLKQQEPHPALVLDRYWIVIRTNEAAPRFFGSFVDLEARKKPRIARPDVRSRGDAAVRGLVRLGFKSAPTCPHVQVPNYANANYFSVASRRSSSLQ